MAQEFDLILPSPLQKISCEQFLDKQNLHVFCKRDDVIHSTISGNKWRKLAPFVKQIESKKIQHILSFGGGYSNHLHALGFICAALKIKLTAFIRGNYSQSLSPMLRDIQNWGVHCEYLTKAEYRQRSEPAYLQQLLQGYHADLLIPEGGSHQDCLVGVAEIVNEYRQQAQKISHVVLPVASGGTMAGIIYRHAQLSSNDKALASPCDSPHIIGIGVLKGKGYLEELVSSLLPKQGPQNGASVEAIDSSLKLPKWHIEHDYHHGGYAKSSPELAEFINTFEHNTHIPIETVYSAKCFYALHQLILNKTFPENSRILLLHTGGLQGKR